MPYGVIAFKVSRRIRFLGTLQGHSAANPTLGALAIDDVFISSIPTNCSEGQYQDESGRPECKPCLAGSYCETRGLVAPTGQCAGGKYSDPGFVTCAVCPPGTWDARSGRANCTDCEAGKYSSEAFRQVECVDLCSIGRYSPGGLPSCPQCPEGQYQPNTGAGTCIACVAGQFSAVLGAATVCTACISGRYNNGTGSILW